MEPREDDSADQYDNRHSSALKDLIRYRSDPSNHLKKYEEEIDRQLLLVSEAIEQNTVKERTETERKERKIKDLQKCLEQSESERRRYRNERENVRERLLIFQKEQEQKPKSHHDLSYIRKIEEHNRELEQREAELNRKLKEFERSSDDILKQQKREIDQKLEDLNVKERNVQQLERETWRERPLYVQKEHEQKPKSDQDVSYIRKLEEKNREHEQREAELNRKLKELEKSTDDIIKEQKREIDQKVGDLDIKERKIQQLQRETWRERSLTFEKEQGQKLTSNQDLSYQRKIEEQIREHEHREAELNRKLKELEQSSDDIIREQKRDIDQKIKDLNIKERKIQQLDKISENSRFGFTELNELKRKLEDTQVQLNEKNDRLTRAMKKLDQTEKELEETKTRLSKSMGDKLTHNNPNIADLSDKHRPTKLAEKYAELYDNQWTDAYEEIERYYPYEEDVIQALLAILLDISAFCKEKANSQMEHLQMALTYSDDQAVPDGITKQMKDLRKAMAAASITNVFQMYLSRVAKTTDSDLRHAGRIKPFVKECFELCWLMELQDPPPVFNPIAKTGEALDTTFYREYTRSGPNIQFVVWPPLMLHASGPILAKGVAQGIDVQRKMSKKAWHANTELPEATTKEVDRETKHYFNRVHYENSREIHAGINVERHHRSKSAETTKPSYRQYTVATKTTRIPTINQEKYPTHKEMKEYFHYMDRRDYSGAIDALGHDAYMRCMLNSEKRHLYY